MTHYRHLPSLLTGLLTTLLLAACSNNDCLITNTAYLRLGLYNQLGQQVALTGTVSVTAAGTDSVLVNREPGPKSFELPLRYTAGEDTFLIHYTEKMVDTLFVRHTNIPHFISMDCGTGMYHHIDSVGSTHNAIDSLRITHPEVTYDLSEHIKIYYTAGL